MVGRAINMVSRVEVLPLLRDYQLATTGCIINIKNEDRNYQYLLSYTCVSKFTSSVSVALKSNRFVCS